MKPLLGVALGIVAAWLPACSTRLTEKQACDLAMAHLSTVDDDGWQYIDLDHFPASAYKNIELVECSDFRTKSDQDWARIEVSARGDEYGLEDGEALGRTLFVTEVQLERVEGAWRVIVQDRL